VFGQVWWSGSGRDYLKKLFKKNTLPDSAFDSFSGLEGPGFVI
jgi:hypothetical protein